MTKKEVLVVLVATHLDQPYKLFSYNSGEKSPMKKLTSGGKIVVSRYSFKSQAKPIKIFRKCLKRLLDFWWWDAVKDVSRGN